MGAIDPDNFTKEFFKRTIKNLEDYEELHTNNPLRYPNNITQLINSLLGLIVFVKDDYDCVDESLYQSISNKINYWEYGTEQKNSKNLIRHLRNAIAHARIETHGTNKSIEDITFKDKDKSYQFEINLNIDEIRSIIDILKNAIVTD